MQNLTAVREMSAGVYGARYRLEICAAVTPGQRFNATDLHARLAQAGDCPPIASVFAELNRLHSAGLISRLPRSTADRAQPLEARDSCLWELARELSREAVQRAQNEQFGIRE